MGAYTTFSTVSLETVRLAEEGAGAAAARNVAVSFVLGLAAASTGIGLAALVSKEPARRSRPFLKSRGIPPITRYCQVPRQRVQPDALADRRASAPAWLGSTAPT